MTVNADDTIGDMKKKIQTKEGIPANRQRLTFRGKPLEYNKAVSDYNIPNEGVLDLVVGKPIKVNIRPIEKDGTPDKKVKPTTVKMDSSDGILKLKEKIEDKEGIAPSRQRLLHNDTPLDDSKCLEDYDIPNDGTTDLMVGKPMDLTIKPSEGDPIPLKSMSNDTSLISKIKLIKKHIFHLKHSD